MARSRPVIRNSPGPREPPCCSAAVILPARIDSAARPVMTPTRSSAPRSRLTRRSAWPATPRPRPRPIRNPRRASWRNEVIPVRQAAPSTRPCNVSPVTCQKSMIPREGRGLPTITFVSTVMPGPSRRITTSVDRRASAQPTRFGRDSCLRPPRLDMIEREYFNLSIQPTMTAHEMPYCSRDQG